MFNDSALAAAAAADMAMPGGMKKERCYYG
jgi:hypothetical protein